MNIPLLRILIGELRNIDSNTSMKKLKIKNLDV